MEIKPPLTLKFHWECPVYPGSKSPAPQKLRLIPKGNLIHFKTRNFVTIWDSKNRPDPHSSGSHQQPPSSISTKGGPPFFVLPVCYPLNKAEAPSDNWLAFPAVITPPSLTGFKPLVLPGWCWSIAFVFFQKNSSWTVFSFPD
ncbi:MAG: hypothetical protein CM1200mP30_04590 [Pseudomonadota bacterium]|nr:MAG: hypothetical protein CM1200mP30_04590 [Pseudomonadota bacterium]